MDRTALYGLGFLAGFIGLAISFGRSLRRKRRGEPLRDVLGREVYPGDPAYNWMWSVAMRLYYIFFGIIGLLCLVVLGLAAEKFYRL